MKPEAMLAVATKSRKTGEQYLEHGNAGRAFAHFLVSLKLQPQWRLELKDSLSASLCAWGHFLEQQKRYRDLFHCYEQALHVFPENEEVLNNLGAHLFRLGHVREATHFFRKSLAANPDFLPATCNLENMASLLVERWHFRMLNDVIRNDAFREAVTKKINQGFDCVLDIGTGTGLLSMFAVSGGATQVFACECSTAMVLIAQQVLHANNMEDRIELVPKMSTDLLIPQDIPCRVSLVVTETMDAGLLGEHVLQTLADAWDRLLLPPCPGLSSKLSSEPSSFTSRQKSPPRTRYGIVVPLGASVWVAAVESSHVRNTNSVPEIVLQSLDLPNVLCQKEEPYDCEDITKLPGTTKLLTVPQDLLYINFNDPEDIQNCLTGNKGTQVKIECCEAGHLDAVIAWFSLRLDEDILLSSAPGRGSCWEQAIFPLAAPLDVQAGQQVEITISCSSGKLSVNLTQNIPTEIPNSLSEHAIQFLNDTPWIEALSQVASNLKHKKELDILDFSPVPVLGLQLLKDGVARSLSCVCKNEVDKSAIHLSAGSRSIQFVREEDVETMTQQFDVIVLHPFSTYGELNQAAMLQIPALRELLKGCCLLLPEKLTVWGKVVNCDWLKKMSRVTSDGNVSGYDIAQFVNSYQVSQHLGLHLCTLEHEALSEPTQLLDITLKDMRPVTENHEKVGITSHGEANAIPYWFEVTWSAANTTSTLQETSHIRQAAVLLDTEHQVSSQHDVIVTTRHQHGFLHLTLSLG